MTRNYFNIIIALLVALALTTACASKNGSEDTKALTQKAIATATKAAKAVVETDHSDTLAMQNAILEAKAMQAEFQVTGDTAVINSYNRAFKKYLQENDPGLAKEMFIERPKDLPEDEQWDEFEQLVKVTNPQEQ